MEAPLEVETVLVPVDGSDEAADAAEYAIAIAAAYDAGLHAVYVLGEDASRAVETGHATAEEVAAGNESVLSRLTDRAEDAGVSVSTSTAFGFSPSRKSHHPGSVVLDTAEQVAADFLVIPREPVGGEPGEVLEKAAEYVLLYASQPVLSV